MARSAAASGTATLVATPHLRGDFPSVRVHELAARCDELRDAIEQEGIELRLVCGAEVSLSWALAASDEELSLSSYDQKGDDLLIEMPASNVVDLDRFLYALRAKGYRITLAHPERNVAFKHGYSFLADLVEQGILLQVNAGSLLGRPRRSSTTKLARQLCTNGIAHVLASDGHRASSWRPVTLLADALGAAATLVGVERAQWMTTAAPAAIIGGVTLPESPTRVGRRRLHR
jgi:protein-tyrosine phosphatase